MANFHRTRLLLVEDEFLIREFLQMVLQDEGFEVEAVSDGSAAIELLQHHPGQLEGLVTDVDLGRGADGWTVARTAREHHPNLPVVYMSGRSACDWTACGVKKSVMVSKPFAPAHLVAVLSSMLIGSSPAPVEHG